MGNQEKKGISNRKIKQSNFEFFSDMYHLRLHNPDLRERACGKMVKSEIALPPISDDMRKAASKPARLLNLHLHQGPHALARIRIGAHGPSGLVDGFDNLPAISALHTTNDICV